MRPLKSLGLKIKNPLLPEAALTEDWFDLLLPVFIILLFTGFVQWQKAKQENPSVWVTESRKLLRTGQYKAALEYTLKLTQAFPKNHDYIDQAAVIYHHLGKYADEAQMLEKFLTVAADPGEACPRLPQAYRALGEQKAMVRAAQKCLSLEPKNSDFLFEMALSYERFGELDKASKIYEDGKNTFTGYTDFAIGYARVLIAQKKPAMAWTEISEVLKNKPTNADAQIVAIKALLALNKKAEALEVLNKAISDHPDYEELQILKERFK